MNSIYQVLISFLNKNFSDLRRGIILILLLWHRPLIGSEMQNQSPLESRIAISSVEKKDSGVNFFEVSASKLETAKFWLKNKTKTVVSQNDIIYLGQKNFSCLKGEAPYLVLANYENGGTGDFKIEKSEKSILILHSSLGRSSTVFQTALVICVDFSPEKITSRVSGAE